MDYTSGTICAGHFMSKVTNLRPLALDVESGKQYAWCSCGRSKNQPLCDGSHVGTDHLPVIFKADESKTVYLCGCKKTGHKPFCDGTHQMFDGGGRDQYFDNIDA